MVQLNRKFRQKAIIAVAALACAAALAACSSSGGSTTPSGASSTTPSGAGSSTATGQSLYSASVHALLPQDVVKKGYIVDGVSNASPPVSYVNASGQYAGYEADISALFSKVMGITIKTPTPIPFDGIVPGILADRFDFGNMNDTVVREKTMDFVDLLYAGPGIAVKSGNPLKITQSTLCGERVSGQQGSVYISGTLPQLSAQCTAAGKKAITITAYPDTNSAILALNAGRTDAVMDDEQTIAWIVKNTTGLTFVPTTIKDGLWGYGFPKGSPLVPAFKAAAQELANDGQLDKIINQYDIQSLRLPKITVNGAAS